jgi:hypothetical protein
MRAPDASCGISRKATTSATTEIPSSSLRVGRVVAFTIRPGIALDVGDGF